jgi:O-antigen ligase
VGYNKISTKDFALFLPFLTIFLFEVGRALGNISYYISLCIFLYFLVREPVKNFPRKLGFLFFCFLLLVSISVCEQGPREIKDLLVFIFSSSVALFFAYNIRFDDLDKLYSFGLLGLVLLLSIETVQALLFYINNENGDPAIGISLWGLVVISPFFLSDKLCLSKKILMFIWVFVLVLLSGSRAEFVALFFAVSIFFSVLYRRFIISLIAIPLAVVFSVFLNNFYRERDFSFDGVESFLSRITSFRSDMWFEAFRRDDHDILLGNGFSTSYQLYEKVHAASVHNVFVELWWESGILSMLAFVFFIIFSGFFIIKNLSRFDRVDNIEALIPILSLSICFTIMMLDKSLYDLIPRFYFFFFVGLALKAHIYWKNNNYAA